MCYCKEIKEKDKKIDKINETLTLGEDHSQNERKLQNKQKKTEELRIIKKKSHTEIPNRNLVNKSEVAFKVSYIALLSEV